MKIIAHHHEKIEAESIYLDIISLSGMCFKDFPEVLEGYIIHFGAKNDYMKVFTEREDHSIPTFNAYCELGEKDLISKKLTHLKDFMFRHREEMAHYTDQFSTLYCFMVMDENEQVKMYISSMDYNCQMLLDKSKEEAIIELQGKLESELEKKTSNSKMKI